MFKWFVSVSLALGSLQVCDGLEWAVLACGSRGFFNYRHHADVCHAYHTLVSRGIASERIITMMYDDVAHDVRNPFPGKLFNRPNNVSEQAFDVYEKCQKDYTGADVTPQQFLGVITGDKSKVKAGGRVLESTEEDDVFINFVDHGAPGLVAFPSAELYAKQLLQALEQMKAKKMYKRLLFYLEACESGSMFQNLTMGENVFAVTAANGQESSWAKYCPPHDDVIGNKSVSSCLGDEFSVNWMEDTDSEIITSPRGESIIDQFERVKKQTVKSHLQDFGDISAIGGEDISDFLGQPANVSNPLVALLVPGHALVGDMVDNRDATLLAKFYAYQRKQDALSLKDLEEEVTHRKRIDEIIHNLGSSMLGALHKELLSSTRGSVDVFEHHDCHAVVNSAFKNYCLDGFWTDYALKHSAALLGMCHHTHDAAGIVAQIKELCESTQVTQSNF